MGRLRVGLRTGETVWIQIDAVKAVLPPAEARAAQAAWKEARLAKMQEEAAALATRRF